MIVVLGDLGPRGASSTPATTVAASAVAVSAVAAGARAQAVGVVAPDASGDAVLLALAEAGVEHAAILRTNRSSMEPADLALALRYLTDTKVIVLVEAQDDLLGAAAEGASWSGARIVAVVAPASAARSDGDVMPAVSRSSGACALPDDALVLEAPRSDPDGAFAGFVGELAARLDRGEEPRTAWESALRSKGVDAVGPRRR